MSSFIELYGGNKDTMAHSGLKAVRAAEAAGLSIGQIRQMAASQGVSFGSGAQDYFRQKERQQFTDQITTLKNTFEQQMQEQQARFAEAQRKQQKRLEQIQQQALEAQTRQAAPDKTAQVLGGGKSMIIRPGNSTRFRRPELQIKSMNI
jgi:DNA-binding transcriptional MerR regulator